MIAKKIAFLRSRSLILRSPIVPRSLAKWRSPIPIQSWKKRSPIDHALHRSKFIWSCFLQANLWQFHPTTLQKRKLIFIVLMNFRFVCRLNIKRFPIDLLLISFSYLANFQEWRSKLLFVCSHYSLRLPWKMFLRRLPESKVCCYTVGKIPYKWFVLVTFWTIAQWSAFYWVGCH